MTVTVDGSAPASLLRRQRNPPIRLRSERDFRHGRECVCRRGCRCLPFQVEASIPASAAPLVDSTAIGHVFTALEWAGSPNEETMTAFASTSPVSAFSVIVTFTFAPLFTLTVPADDAPAIAKVSMGLEALLVSVAETSQSPIF